MPKYKSKFINAIENHDNKSEMTYQLSGLQYTIKNAGTDTAEIDIDGAIGFDWMKWYDDEPQNDSVTIKRALRDIKSKNIVVNINSLGGDVNDGLMIHDLLKEKNANVTTVIRGLTASAGTIVSQAGHRKMSANAKMLVHKGLGFLFGWFNANDLEPVVDDLTVISDLIAEVYAKAGSKDKEYYKDLMNEFNGRGRWLSASEALEAGLIDEIYEPGEDESKKEKETIDNFKSQLETFQRMNMNAFLLTLNN